MAALELGSRGIRVNAVCPGYIETALGSGDEGKLLSQQFTALRRAGTTEDLAGVFHFLASNESRYITGQALAVDGGWSCGPTPQLLETILGSSKVS
jgi:3-oxoacyl-[acyl-carrier protein] reductase